MPSNRQTGFTLVELMIAVAVLAILLGLALPSFQASMRSNRVATTSNELLGSLSLARTEAIRGLGPAGVCASADGAACTATTDWANGWIVWREDRAAGGVTTRTVVRYIQPKQRMAIVGPNDGMQFTTQGRAQGGADRFGVAPADAVAPARCLMINATGQARISQGACV
ncbi:GspH/FimT family pseudopilin [Pseudoxanthomonas daejeonensis]|uniref:Type II secretion system protein H n=1 Tax=Pseudoxanthomonas daejeonensis TaxID=266062 RepID=A0ABQ6Z7B9_9GAMM|nr:GspH/FimT family pseudopilin [Pseudoxanthomonas daejeonensis]KAF1694728.1 pre-pilin like leader sequence [Pseudoxanthomonas daejeonensis]